MTNFLSILMLLFSSSVLLAAHEEGGTPIPVVAPIDEPITPNPNWFDPNHYGKLHFNELSTIKSFEAYDGLEFWLIEDSGYIRPLEESELVDRQTLINAKNKNVRLQGELFSPPAPSGPGYNCPIDDEGNCLPRTCRLKVTQLEVLN